MGATSCADAFRLFKDAVARKAKNESLPSDEVWLSGAESRGVAMPDGTIMAASEVVLPAGTFSLKEVAQAQRRRKVAVEAMTTGGCWRCVGRE